MGDGSIMITKVVERLDGGQRGSKDGHKEIVEAWALKSEII